MSLSAESDRQCLGTCGYPYYVDKKKKEYLPPSEAEARGLERADKHPKSTKFGRQNPITERWNSDEQLILWRSAWADTVNRALERNGIEERIDHRSHAERGLDEQPTVHEGVEARAMERKGFVSDRCELNRQIKADNALLRELKTAVRKLMQAVQNTISEHEQKYRAELTKALADYAEVKQQSEPLDRTELYRTRLALRPGYENAAIDGLRKMLGGDFSVWDFRDAVAAADNTLGERAEESRVRELLRTQERQKRSAEKRRDGMER